MKRWRQVFLVGWMLVVLAPLGAANLTADQIVDAMTTAMDYQDATFSATLVNTDRLGSTSLTFDTYQNARDDTLLVVTEGADAGQKILRLDDDIYLYYPDADEIIRLSGSSLKNAFLGTDFSYEDLTGDDDYTSRFTSTLNGTESIDGVSCYVITLTAKKLSEPYQMEKMWIDQQRFIPLKTVLYSKSGKLLKVMTYQEYLHDGDVWFPGSIHVTNAVKKGNSSVMTVTNATFNKGVDPSLFKKETLAW